MATICKDLIKWFSNRKRVVIVGVGNLLRHDDGVGIKVVEQLRNKISQDSIYLIVSENIPEDFLEPIINYYPSHVLIIDAALLNLKPGQIRLTDPSHIKRIAISTHSLPLYFFCEYIARITQAKIGLLLIQPENLEFGEGLTPTLEATVTDLVRSLLTILSDEGAH